MRVDVKREQNAANVVRIGGEIAMGEGARTVWFEFPAPLADQVSMSGNAWLALMLPLAVQTGERIDLDLPVDPLFLENIREIAAIWRRWYPELRFGGIRAPTQRSGSADGRVAQFFSGGVDAWFTLLRHTASTPRFPQVGDVHDLITVAGLDIPIAKVDEFAQLERRTHEIASTHGLQHIVVRTNLREHLDGAWKAAWGRSWGSLSHVAALAAIGLMLEGRYSQILVGSTGLGELPPWGSHPLTDSLFSTSGTQLRHDHPVYSRARKMERIAESRHALSSLKVCFSQGTFRNCSVCGKCHRTLTCLDILGVLDQAASFDVDAYLRNRERMILVWSDIDRVLAQDVRDLAVDHGRPEVAALIERSIERSRRIKSVTEPLERLTWRGSRALYRKLAGDMIGA